MIKKLRAKLILACMFSLAVVLLVILGGVNLMSYQKVVSDADTVLALLAANNGTFPKPPAPQDRHCICRPGAAAPAFPPWYRNGLWDCGILVWCKKI